MADILYIEPATAFNQAHSTRIRQSVESAGLTLTSYSPENVSARLTEHAGHATSCVAVLIPDGERAIGLARKVSSAMRGTPVLLLPQGAVTATLDKEVSLSAMLGHQFTVVRRIEDLPRILKEVVRTCEQQRRHRTTLDRMNLALSARPAVEGGQLRKLLISDRYLASILTQASDAIVSLDHTASIQSWNPAAEALFGIPAAAAVGRSFDAVVPSLGGFSDLLQRVRAGQTVAPQELRLELGGRIVEVDASITPIRDPGGGLVGFSSIIRDVSERKATEAALAEMQERYRLMVESAKDFAIVSLDAAGRVTSWNPGAKNIFGYEEAEILGQEAAALFTEEERAAGAPGDELSRAIAAGHANDDRWLLRKDGTRLFASGVITPMRARGQLIGFTKVCRDITDRKRLEKEREDLLNAERTARAEAERASRMKDEFLATLSHELRTPLNAILGWAGILRSPRCMPEDLTAGLEVIERNTRVQAQLIEDLLDMSRIISGKIRLDVQRVSLPEVLDAAIEAVKPAANAKSIRIEKVLDPFAGPVSGDPARLQQVFWNLLSNAVKFTPKGGKVQVLLERVNSHLEVTVSDNGEGMTAEFLPHVFERFRQADASTTRRHGGLGLGLSIVKQLVELHGGSVRAKSGGVGKGSAFMVDLPLVVVHPPHEAEERTHPRSGGKPKIDHPPQSLAGIRVLVVEDEPDARDLIRRVLTDAQATVILAGSATEGLEQLKGRPHIIVSDIGMAGMDGYEFIGQVRSATDSEVARTPAIALTAFARVEDRTRALVAGFQTHLAKPVEPAELVAVVHSLFGMRERSG